MTVVGISKMPVHRPAVVTEAGDLKTPELDGGIERTGERNVRGHQVSCGGSSMFQHKKEKNNGLYNVISVSPGNRLLEQGAAIHQYASTKTCRGWSGG